MFKGFAGYLVFAGERPLVIDYHRMALVVDVDAVDFAHKGEACVADLLVGIDLVLEIRRVERGQEPCLEIEERYELLAQCRHLAPLEFGGVHEPAAFRLFGELGVGKLGNDVSHELSGSRQVLLGHLHMAQRLELPVERFERGMRERALFERAETLVEHVDAQPARSEPPQGALKVRLDARGRQMPCRST